MELLFRKGVKKVIHLLNKTQLAQRLGKTVTSISTDMTRKPGSLPRWFKLPGCKAPMWLETTVDEFIIKSAERAGATPEGIDDQASAVVRRATGRVR